MERHWFLVRHRILFKTLILTNSIYPIPPKPLTGPYTLLIG